MAIKVLEWDRELNMIQYHGAQEYLRRWWVSKSWSPSSLFAGSSSTSAASSTNTTATSSQSSVGDNDDNNQATNKTNVARVAFMITSEQRQKLSIELGYTPQDIRSIKPIEALLLLEHGIQRVSDGGDFRSTLKELLEENESLMNAQHEQEEQRDVLHNRDGGEGDNNMSKQQSLTPELSEQMHVKPDVALALLSAEKESQDETTGGVFNEENAIFGTDDVSDKAPLLSTDANGELTTQDATKSRIAANVTPHDSEVLHMKPDVAAAFLASHQEKEQRIEQQQIVQEEGDNEVATEDCWYEVIEKFPSRSVSASADDNGSQQFEGPIEERVIALFPTKKEALECAAIKERSRSGRGEGDANTDGENAVKSFFVRRRWSE